MEEDPHNLGLALGGGAFRGTAHLGVLKALEEENLRPCALCGTSAGAMAAAFYAFGMPPEEIRNVARNLRWLKATNLTFSKLGLLSNNEIGKFIEKYLGDVLIEDSTIPLAIVAADISTGEKVVFKTGSLSTAIMASTCIPGVFMPTQVDGKMLVDGAIVENVPVSVVKEMGAKVCVGVDLGSGGYRQPETLVEVLLNAFSIAIDRSIHHQGDLADVIIKPSLAGYSLTDSGNSMKLYAEGYRSGIMALDEIKLLVEKAGPSSLEVLEQKFKSWLDS
ncbi:MAG: patatin-like phospholipase family protein [SAR324 cluster bacterium]|nr:patatin-like phospholipase family protein [SAR324 cluster bacterium]MBL7035366.1 patatin-like phospholipase family protein [SAR324 cluster bacterium]